MTTKDNASGQARTRRVPQVRFAEEQAPDPQASTPRRRPSAKKAAVKAEPVKAGPRAATTARVPVQAVPGGPKAHQVWRSTPPLGNPAASTRQVALAARMPEKVVLGHLERLADAGRAQRLIRDGQDGLWWRRLP